MRVREIVAKSIITPTRLPGADVVVNPYVGCSFACGYCYASFMGRFVGEPIEAWGDYVYAKTNAVEVFRRDLERLQRKMPHATLLMSSVTDAWQGPEKKYRLTRGILQHLVERAYRGQISLLTKSPLLLRDLDLIAALNDVEVGVTITAPDDHIGRELESRAPSMRRRYAVLRACRDAGIKTYAFLGPILPHFVTHPSTLDRVFAALAEAGVTTVFAEQLNSSAYIRHRIEPLLAGVSADIRSTYDEMGHRQAARTAVMIRGLVERHGLRLRLGSVIDHRRDGRAR